MNIFVNFYTVLTKSNLSLSMLTFGLPKILLLNPPWQSEPAEIIRLFSSQNFI